MKQNYKLYEKLDKNIYEFIICKSVYIFLNKFLRITTLANKVDNLFP